MEKVFVLSVGPRAKFDGVIHQERATINIKVTVTRTNFIGGLKMSKTWQPLIINKYLWEHSCPLEGVIIVVSLWFNVKWHWLFRHRT